MANTSEAIIIFIRNPELGKVKTRLAGEVGDEAALAIYRHLLQHTYKVVQQSPAAKLVGYSNEIIAKDLWQGSSFQKFKQKGEDLGERMLTAFQDAFNSGFDRVIIIGSDLMSLDKKHIEGAFRALHQNKVVIGPAIDGGYYLLGLTQIPPAIFKDKNWGTSTVLKETLANLDTKEYQLLEPLNDIDYKEDMMSYPELVELLHKYSK